MGKSANVYCEGKQVPLQGAWNKKVFEGWKKEHVEVSSDAPAVCMKKHGSRELATKREADRVVEL